MIRRGGGGEGHHKIKKMIYLNYDEFIVEKLLYDLKCPFVCLSVHLSVCIKLFLEILIFSVLIKMEV